MSTETRIRIDEKYTVVHTNGANLHALRYGEHWRDLTGDGLVLAMAQKIEELEEKLLLMKKIEHSFDIEIRIDGAIRISPK